MFFTERLVKYDNSKIINVKTKESGRHRIVTSQSHGDHVIEKAQS